GGAALHVHRLSTQPGHCLAGDRGGRDADRRARGRWLSLAGIQRADLRAHHLVHPDHWHRRFRARPLDEPGRASLQGGLSMAFIELSGVCKGYGRAGQRTAVLEDVNLSIEEGELVSIVGYSGAGKTTLAS